MNCTSDPTTFANSQPSASNFKSFSRSPEQFFLKVGQNNFGNKISLYFYFPFLFGLFYGDSQELILELYKLYILSFYFIEFCFFLFFCSFRSYCCLILDSSIFFTFSIRETVLLIVLLVVWVEIDSITAKPYIPQKSWFQWICSKFFVLWHGHDYFWPPWLWRMLDLKAPECTLWQACYSELVNYE